MMAEVAAAASQPAMVMGTFFVHLEIASPRGGLRRRRSRLMSLLIGRKAPSMIFCDLISVGNRWIVPTKHLMHRGVYKNHRQRGTMGPFLEKKTI